MKEMNTFYPRKLMLIVCVLFLTGTGVCQNLITNGSFESGTTDWNNLAGDGGAATFTISTDAAVGSNSLEIALNTLGANPWSIQSIHTTTTLVQGQPYTLTFFAKAATNGTSLNVVIQNTSYLAQSFSLTTSWTKYQWNFTAAETSPQLKFQYPQTGTYYIDGIQMISQATTGNLNITVSPSTTYQTMVGFGGAITWYCPRIISSPNKTTISQLLFSDLGTDIVRFKNWYYPSGYPTNTTPSSMEPGSDVGSFNATNQLYTLAKQYNPDIEILLSSWTPPIALKSNDNENGGTLLKSNSLFVYSEFGQFWSDVLDNITFNPDYISVQNEPGYVNTGWATCKWAPTENDTLPGYDQGFDAVYNAIKNRSYVPKMLGPEAENIGAASWNSSLNTFREFATPIESRPYLYGYAYHLYNFAGTPNNLSASTLNMLKNEFNNVPNFMTEFSSNNFDWLATADAIYQTVVEANASAYIYWELMWDSADTIAIMGIDGSGNYTLNPHYYTLKHYAKFVDKGYQRIDVSGGNSNVEVSGYLNPAGNQVTLVAINKNASSQGIVLNVDSVTVTGATAYQSVAGNFYQSLGSIDVSQAVTLPAKSLTTFVVDLSSVITGISGFNASSGTSTLDVYPNPFPDALILNESGMFSYVIYDMAGNEMEKGSGQDQVHVGNRLQAGLYLLKVQTPETIKVAKIRKSGY